MGNRKVLCRKISGNLKAVAGKHAEKDGGRMGDWKVLRSNAKHIKKWTVGCPKSQTKQYLEEG